MTDKENAIHAAVIKHLPCIPTLEERGTDALDFPVCHISALRKALEQVYEQGLADGKSSSPVPVLRRK